MIVFSPANSGVECYGLLAKRYRLRFSAAQRFVRMIKQRTLKNVIRAMGIGLHSGEKIHLALRPAPPHTGIVFSPN